MQEKTLTITENKPITSDVFRMTFAGDTSDCVFPGKFVNIQIPGRYLRRPISVSDATDTSVALLYKVVGHGTEDLSRMKEGGTLDVITGLGNGFDLSKAGEKPLLLGGGIGCAPLYLLAKKLKNAGCDVSVVLGYNTAGEDYISREFEALGVKTTIMTLDGSQGLKGFATDAVKDIEYTYTYACGPMPMLKAVYRTVSCGELSLEARMGCGFGACMGCTIKTSTGHACICKNGPVFTKEALAWED